MEDAFNVTRAFCGNGGSGQHGEHPAAGPAMNASLPKISTAHSNSPGHDPAMQEDAGYCRRPISLLSFLEAENTRLRQIATELSLDIIALRKYSQSPATFSNTVK
jgi:hypothetical protein